MHIYANLKSMVGASTPFHNMKYLQSLTLHDMRLTNNSTNCKKKYKDEKFTLVVRF